MNTATYNEIANRIAALDSQINHLIEDEERFKRNAEECRATRAGLVELREGYRGIINHEDLRRLVEAD